LHLISWLFNCSYKVKLIIPNVATKIKLIIANVATNPPTQEHKNKKQPTQTNQPQGIARAKPKTTNPTTKAKATKENGTARNPSKTTYPVLENRNPKK
jgi:hypothetical protein